VVGVLLAFAKGPILVLAALVGFFIGLVWLTSRYPLMMIVIISFCRGLFGGRRRRW
jgi:hypothetical protein